jgi:hypothetical protein
VTNALTTAIKADSTFFRDKMPTGARLFIGLTPGLLSAASPNERAERDALMGEWAEGIGADVILTNLPPSLADVFFTAGDHLNRAGQAVFTRRLAQELKPFLN